MRTLQKNFHEAALPIQIMATFAKKKPTHMRILEFIRRHKYILTIAAFAFILLFGNNRIAVNRDLKRQIKEKEKVIEQERAKIDSVELQIEQLQQDPVMQEEYVRNRYHLKKPNEDIFHISRSSATDQKKRKP